MQKRYAKLALMMAMLMVCSMVPVMVPASIQTAAAEAPPLPPTTQANAGGASIPVDGQIVSAVTSSSSTYMLTADGKVFSFGQGTRGELGDGIGQNGTLQGVSAADMPNNNMQAKPVRKWDNGEILTGIDRIYAGLYFAVFGYDADTGTLYGWGQNGNYRIDTIGDPYGSAGDPCEEYNKAKVVTQVPAGIKLQGGDSGLAVGRFHVAFIDDAGSVWTYGWNNGNFILGYEIAQGDPNTYFDASRGNIYTTKARIVALPFVGEEKAIAVKNTIFEHRNYVLTDAGRIMVWGGPGLLGLIGESYQVLSNPAGTDASFKYTDMALAQGGYLVALGNNGKVYALGSNDVSIGAFQPTLVSELNQTAGTNYMDVGAVGQTESSGGFAIRDDGSIWAWGNQAYGQLGNGQYTGIVTTAVQVEALTGASVQTFYNGGIAIKGGKLYCWGNNVDALSGSKIMPISDSPRATIPTQAKNSMMPPELQLTNDAYPAGTPWADATYTLTADVNGSDVTFVVYGLDDRLEGHSVEFYDGSGASYGTSVVSGGSATWMAYGLADGDYQVFVKSLDATELLWAPALNGTTFAVVPPLPPPAKVIAGNGGSYAMDGHIVSAMQSSGSTYILAADGKVFSFGQGARGELGDGYGQAGTPGGVSAYPMQNNITQARPVRKWDDDSILTGVDNVYGGMYFAILAYDADAGILYGWGQNGNYRIDSMGQPYGGGDACEEYNKAKVVTQIPAGVKLQGGAQGVALGRYHVSFIDLDGHVWTYGQSNAFFRLGYPLAQGDPDTYYDAGYGVVYTTKARQVALPLNEGEKARAVSIGHYDEQTNFALTDQGRIIVWGGANLSALIGLTYKVLDNPIGTDGSFKYVKTAVTQGGNLLALGNDGKIYSLLSDSLTTGTYQPTLVTALDQSAGISYVDVGAVGQTTTGGGFAVRNDSSVWAWGSQAYGQLGNGLYIGTATTAVEMTALTGASIQSYYNGAVAVVGEKLYCWGNNIDGSSGSKIMPIVESPKAIVPTQASNDMMPPALQLIGDEYPADTPWSDATYTLSAEVTNSDAVLTVSGVDARLESKTVEFYDENGVSYGTATVSGGTASVTALGLADGSYQAMVKSLDTTELLWAPALNDTTFEVGGVIGWFVKDAWPTITTAPPPLVYIKGIVTNALGVPLTTGADMKAGFTVWGGYSVKVIKTNESELLDTAKVGTAMRAVVYDAGSVEQAVFNIVIYGDITGDAIINAMDLLALKKKILGQTVLADAYLVAANCNKDAANTVNAMDLLALKKHILGTLVIVQ